MARTQAMTAGSTLQSARDAIQVAENRAREVRGMAWGSGADGISAVESKTDALSTLWVGRLALGKYGWHWAGARAVGLAPLAWWFAVPAAACVHTCQAERRLQVLDRKESQAQRRLQELAQGITALQKSARDAHHMAQQAKDRAQHATTTSGTLSQVSSIPAWLCMAPSKYWALWMLSLTMPFCCQDLAQVTQRYVVLKNRVGMLDRESGGVLQRVSQLMAEAQDLLDKANNSKRKLEGEREHMVGYISCHLPTHLPVSSCAHPCRVSRR